jgi:hypothetical protein
VTKVSTSPQLQKLLPGAANHEPFQRVGHSIAALLVGLAGAMVAQGFYRKRLTT